MKKRVEGIKVIKNWNLNKCDFFILCSVGLVSDSVGICSLDNKREIIV